MKKSTYVICVILAILAVAGLSDGNFLMFLVFGLACAGFYVLRKRKADRSMTAVKQDVRELDPETPLPVVLNSGVVLTSGEICHYYGEATQYILKERVVGYTGGSSGVSVRIAKGVTYRTGSRRGAPVREKTTDKTPGFLAITNKRIIFTSIKNSFDKKLSALSTANPLDDGIVLQFGDKQYMLELKEAQYVFQIIQRVTSDSSL